jgi:four helix bundle protein
MSAIRSFRDLEAWKRAMRLAVEAYRVSEQFPRHERFGLTHQFRRAAISIPSNIAEGHSRRTRPAYINHLNIALGSLAEFETQLVLAVSLGFVPEQEIGQLARFLRETSQLVMALVHALEQSPSAA